MRRISASELQRIKIAELGLNPDGYALDSTEALACALRRAAAHQAPCSAATLIRTVMAAQEGLISEPESFLLRLQDVLETLVAHGDLLEQKDISDSAAGGTLLYAATPSFVLRKTGAALLFGVVPDLRTPLPSDLEGRTTHVGHMRKIEPSTTTESLRELLLACGLVELGSDYWLRTPTQTTAVQHIRFIEEMFSKAPAFSTAVPSLTILDTEKPVRYYRGRWVSPDSHSGRYVARRVQAYGADLWCYAELREGKVEKLIDLPLPGYRHRACDAAWHSQMAFDAAAGRPQQFVVENDEENGSRVFRLFSPIPRWAQRRLSAIGRPIEAKGCLLAFAISSQDVDEESTSLEQSLWLAQTK